MADAMQKIAAIGETINKNRVRSCIGFLKCCDAGIRGAGSTFSGLGNSVIPWLVATGSSWSKGVDSDGPPFGSVIVMYVNCLIN